MGAHQAALPFKTLPTGDRLCAMTSHSGARLRGDSVGMTCERRRVTVAGSAPIRGETTPARGDDDEPKYHFFRKPAPGTGTTSFHRINQQLSLALDNPQAIVNRLIAKSAMSKTEGWEMEETKNENAEGCSEQLQSDSMYCDILPRSLACQFLQLASRICEEVDSEFQLCESKKPHRLSTTSWDLLD